MVLVSLATTTPEWSRRSHRRRSSGRLRRASPSPSFPAEFAHGLPQSAGRSRSDCTDRATVKVRRDWCVRRGPGSCAGGLQFSRIDCPNPYLERESHVLAAHVSEVLHLCPPLGRTLGRQNRSVLSQRLQVGQRQRVRQLRAVVRPLPLLLHRDEMCNVNAVFHYPYRVPKNFRNMAMLVV